MADSIIENILIGGRINVSEEKLTLAPERLAKYQQQDDLWQCLKRYTTDMKEFKYQPKSKTLHGALDLKMLVRDLQAVSLIDVSLSRKLI